jgi:hypothetical protein
MHRYDVVSELASERSNVACARLDIPKFWPMQTKLSWADFDLRQILCLCVSQAFDISSGHLELKRLRRPHCVHLS